MWNDGHSALSNKLMLRFGSKEESELTQLLYEVFQLQFIKDIPEVKSLGALPLGRKRILYAEVKVPSLGTHILRWDKRVSCIHHQAPHRSS